MLIPYLIVSLAIGLFLAIIWQKSSTADIITKVMFCLYSVWSLVVLLIALSPIIQTSQMRLF